MKETVITVAGNVATQPKLRLTANGTRVVGFRLASTERRFDKALNGWRDGDTTFYTVTCWRNFGDNVLDSLKTGQPVLVHGRLRAGSYEKEGQMRSVLEIEAYSLGHDISRGVSVFARASQSERPGVVFDDDDEEAAEHAGAGFDAPSGPQPRVDDIDAGEIEDGDIEDGDIEDGDIQDKDALSTSAA